MKRIAPHHLPRMREQGLVVDHLPEEVLVYDLERHKAHCLNQTAALVWQHCDGRTTPKEIARLLEKELDAPCAEDVVLLALRQLKRIHLLAEPTIMPSQLAGLSARPMVHLSRRQMVRTLGIAAAVALPLVSSIVSPTPADAATCANATESCVIKTCCVGLICQPDQTCA